MAECETAALGAGDLLLTSVGESESGKISAMMDKNVVALGATEIWEELQVECFKIP